MPCLRQSALQHGEVEVDDVPAGEDVGIELVEEREEALQERALVGEALGAAQRPGTDDQHAVGAEAGEADGVERARRSGRSRCRATAPGASATSRRA